MKSVGALCAALAASMAIVFAPAPAQAGNNDGFGNAGEFVQWWDGYFYESCYDEYYSATNYSGKVFKSTSFCPGYGAGENPTNNQGSVANYDSNYRVVYWTGANYTGSAWMARKYAECPAADDCWYYGDIGVGWRLNIESHYFVS